MFLTSSLLLLKLLLFPWVLLGLWISAWNTNIKLLNLIISIASYSFNLIKCNTNVVWFECVEKFIFPVVLFYLFLPLFLMRVRIENVQSTCIAYYWLLTFFIPSDRGSLFFQFKVFLLSRTQEENRDKYRCVLNKACDCSYNRCRFLLHHQTVTNQFRYFMIFFVLTVKSDLLISQIYDLMLQVFEALWELRDPSSYSLLFWYNKKNILLLQLLISWTSCFCY